MHLSLALHWLELPLELPSEHANSSPTVNTKTKISSACLTILSILAIYSRIFKLVPAWYQRERARYIGDRWALAKFNR